MWKKNGRRILHTVLFAVVLGIGVSACSVGVRYRNPVEARGVNNQAYNSGYRDGQIQGRDDARHNRRADPSAARRHRSGDHDYNARYGSRGDYQDLYRKAFEQGYDVGYRGAR